MYGILRAPGASSTEALVLTAPFRPPEGNLDKTSGGIALMLGLAKAFRSKLLNVFIFLEVALGCCFASTCWDQYVWYFCITSNRTRPCILGHTYWAKDIIFLVTEYEQIGMQAWLAGYHYHTTPCKFGLIAVVQLHFTGVESSPRCGCQHPCQAAVVSLLPKKPTPDWKHHLSW